MNIIREEAYRLLAIQYPDYIGQIFRGDKLKFNIDVSNSVLGSQISNVMASAVVEDDQLEIVIMCSTIKPVEYINAIIFLSRE